MKFVVKLFSHFLLFMWGCGGVVVSAAVSRFKGSLVRFQGSLAVPSCCFLRQETLLHTVSVLPGVSMGPAGR